MGKANECPLELQGIFKDHKIIEWHRIKDFQVVSLKLLASELLLACPGYDTLYSDIHVPGEITEATLKLTDVRIYTSPDNPGAREVAEILQKQIKGLQLSAVPPPAVGTHFLLYLAHETFVGEAGERLAEEVRRMTRTNQPIVMLHEN